MGEKQGYEREREQQHQSTTYISFPDDSQVSEGGIAYQPRSHTQQEDPPSRITHPPTETEHKKGRVHVTWVRARGAPGLSLNC